MLLGVSAALLLAALAGGCGSTENLTTLKSPSEFDRTLASGKPFMVEFYKLGCPPCVMLEPTMDKLSREYSGKAEVAKMEMMTPYFAIEHKEMAQKYDLGWFPTVILFVNGHEAKRWVGLKDEEVYRQALDEVIAQACPPAKTG